MSITLTIIFLIILGSAVSAPANCNCQSPESLNKTHEHLKLATKISAMKLVNSLRDLLHQTSQERIYALDLTRYDVVKDLQNTYGKLITHTDFNEHFDALVKEIKRLLNDDEVLESHKLQKEMTEAVEKTFSGLLPSAFLCLSMGECISAPPNYVECMASHAHKWTIHFGKEPVKMSRRLYESVARYKLIEKRLTALQNILINAEKQILPSCVERYTNLTQCGNCLADRTTYCRKSCEEVAADCYLGISSDWDENISGLEQLAKDFSDGFYALEKGIHNSLRKLVEVTSPNLAVDVVDACGALSEKSKPTKASFMQNVKPTVIAKRSERLIQQLLSYRGHWKRLSKNFCSEPSSDNFCWNGTNIVRAQAIVDELPAITKDVRPRPIDPRITAYDSRVEGSGASGIRWSDDEDLVEGSGSGSLPVDDEEYARVNDIFATPTPIPIDSFTTTASTTALKPLIVKAEVIDVVDEEKPDTASSWNGLISLVVGTLVFLLF